MNCVVLEPAELPDPKVGTAVALQGPQSRNVLQDVTDEDWTDLRYFRERATSIRGIPVEVTRTGYTGDLGYELWVEAGQAVAMWDALMDAGCDSEEVLEHCRKADGHVRGCWLIDLLLGKP